MEKRKYIVYSICLEVLQNPRSIIIVIINPWGGLYQNTIFSNFLNSFQVATHFNSNKMWNQTINVDMHYKVN